MKNSKNSISKHKISSIFVILLLASVMLMATSAMPVRAQNTGLQNNGSIPLPAGVTPDETYEAIAHMSFRPNPVGVSQPILVNMWLQPPLHVVRLFEKAYVVTLTKPDGTTEVMGPYSSYLGDATAWFEYTPDQVGTWTIKFDFTGAFFPAGNYTTPGSFMHDSIVSFPNSVYYKPDSDGPYNFTVQEGMVASWPASPLPTDYWTRPVSPENREWWPILGGYPATGIVGGGPGWPADTNIYMSNYGFTPYVQAPKSAHIIWKRQDAISGIIGGSMGQLSLSSSGSTPRLIFAGRAYQTLTKMVDGKPTSVWECYDLRTGEVYWDQTGVTQVPTMISYITRTSETVPGETAATSGLQVRLMYVGSSRLIWYDPWLGTPTTNISISPFTTGTFYMQDKDGWPVFLAVQTLAGKNYLINWKIVGDVAFGGATNLRPGVLSNVSWPFSSLGTVDYEAGVAVNTESITTPGTGGIGQGFVVAYGQRIMGASITTGQLLFNTTTDTTTGLGGFFSGSTAVADHGKYAVRLNDGHWHCWDLRSGKELWTSELSSWPWGTFGCYGVQSYGGNIISNQYDGVVAYNWNTGKISWWYESKLNYPYESPYGDNYPWFTGTTDIADGVIYTYNTEHSPSEPIMRGEKLHAINATTGEGIWNITGPMAPGGVADGYLTAGNSYDGYMYVFGKGPSVTTVTAPSLAIQSGTSAVISGTVLDQSPAQPGKACVSDNSMSTYMEYLHMQHPIDGLSHNITVIGVPVSLDAVDPNGNNIHIATVNSDFSGTFHYTWTPTIAGDYQITATFAGTNSYGSSWAETAATVSSTITANPTENPVINVPTNEMYLAISTIAIIIAIVIVGAVLALMLKKRA